MCSFAFVHMCGYAFVHLYSLMLVRMVGRMCKYMIQIAVWSVCVNVRSALVYAYVCVRGYVYIHVCMRVCDYVHTKDITSTYSAWYL